jgi:superfamily II DNA or RNA helicase
MEKVVLKQQDNVFFKVETSPSIQMELSDFFTFEVPDAKFHPLFKAKRWDGKKRLFNRKTKEIYIGLIKHLSLFCEERGYELVMPEDFSVTNNISESEVRNWIADVIKPSDENGEPMVVRDSQIKAITIALNEDRKTILSPTGSGKSLIIYCIVRFLISHPKLKGKRILVLVPRVGLVNQLVTNFKDYSKINGWNVDKNVHKIFSGMDKVSSSKIFISTWQSIYELGEDYFSGFAAVIVDEVHEAEAKSITGIMEMLKNAFRRIGLTGTLKDAKTHRLVIEGLFGSTVRVETTKDMQERGELADIDINMLFLKHSDDDCKALSKTKKEIDESNMKSKASKKYFAEIEAICANAKRNLFIKNLAIKQEQNTLVLFQYVEKHGMILRDLIETDAQADRKVFFVYQGTSAEQREEIRAIVSKEKNAIIVASYGTFSTGIDIKRIHTIVLASPSSQKSGFYNQSGEV